MQTMLNGRSPLYKHLVGKLTGVKIEFKNELIHIMTTVSKRCEFNVLSANYEQFVPVGVTGVLVLSESHYSMHTYPEHETVYFDVFCCAADFDPHKTADIIKDVCGGEIQFDVIDR